MAGNTTDLPDLGTAREFLEQRMDIKQLWDTAGWDNEEFIQEVRDIYVPFSDVIEKVAAFTNLFQLN